MTITPIAQREKRRLCVAGGPAGKLVPCAVLRMSLTCSLSLPGL